MSFVAKNPVHDAFSFHVPLTSSTLEHFFSLSLTLMTLTLLRASFVAQLVKNSPAMWDTWIQSLDWEDPLEKGEASHSSILAWSISWSV